MRWHIEKSECYANVVAGFCVNWSSLLERVYIIIRYKVAASMCNIFTMFYIIAGRTNKRNKLCILLARERESLSQVKFVEDLLIVHKSYPK